MNKNWNDRADKDLFFTILSVKNIGVISGAEWTTIGNHMRALGYGFTNEGCRQHFQGLRRAQNKSDAGGTLMPDGTRRPVDPTLNPITRRPGPGRGRPRKQPQTQPGPVVSLPQAQLHHVPTQQPLVQVPLQDQHQVQQAQPQEPQQLQQLQHQQPSQILPTQLHVPMDSIQPSESPTLSPPVSVENTLPAALSVSVPVPVSLDPSEALTLPDNDEDDEPDDHIVKRQRLDDSPTEQTLDENDVLGQLTHGTAPDSYPSPTFNYAEA
ncbi:unnamed protein product [Parascedosporium putredinis]|uniref:Myb-like domain-containing protein n=1 Tax=Parascedosporium putredinis TaxID=1442378 RepID=A0A9P1GY72_9PEZI|nr:unnamed protein product [Parascedosporium putredinis]CAI7990480.1 unnamed protein product [Parascedosporium putredinis]